MSLNLYRKKKTGHEKKCYLNILKSQCFDKKILAHFKKLNCHIIYQIEKKIDVVVGALVGQGITQLPLLVFRSTWETDIRIMSGNHIWRNVAWPVPKKPCYYFMCEFNLPTKSWALIKSLWRPVWAPDCVKFRARKSSDDVLPADSCLSGREGRDEGACWAPPSKPTKQMRFPSSCRKVSKG